ncbi:MAG: SUMF1/EgtB/PvdO family nonheme iron enzyme [Hyphomicrobiaceae bacterium]|nr:SUMF1/EgtB/PvdO family nonheme iron enzyme [Hyphomicrobiaceae bacterium]
MLSFDTFIFIAVAATLGTAGLLAWIIDGGVPDKYQAPIRYGLFGMFAAIIGLFFLIDDQSEFEYKDWEFEEKQGQAKQSAGMDIANKKAAAAAPQKAKQGDGGAPAAAPATGGEAGDGDKADDGKNQKIVGKSDCDVCPKIVPIEPGVALLGSPLSVVSGTAQTGPPMQQTFTKGYGIGQFEISLTEFNAFAKETGYKTKAPCRVAGTKRTYGNVNDPGFTQEANSPAVCVTWMDANHYVDWLSQKTKARYRLPTEAEWEFAARAGMTTAYASGGILEPGAANFTAKHAASVSRTAPVGSYEPNGFGLYDVHGNVWELTADCWSAGYQIPPVGDQPPPPKADCSRKVAKGGGWFSPPEQLNFAIRVAIEPETASNGMGFRVVRENDPVAKPAAEAGDANGKLAQSIAGAKQ